MKLADQVAAPAVADSVTSLTSDNDKLVNELIIQAPEANAANILVGDSAAQPAFIKPGGAMTLWNVSLASVYVKGTAPDEVIFLSPS